MKSRAQVSLEYLIIIALATMLVLPTFYIFYVQTQDSNAQITATRLDRFGNELIKQSRTIYYTGRYAKTFVEFEFPDNVIAINATFDAVTYPRSELFFTVAQGRFNQTMVFYSDVPIKTGNCTDGVFDFNASGLSQDPQRYTPGKRKVVVESCGNVTAVYEAR